MTPAEQDTLDRLTDIHTMLMSCLSPVIVEASGMFRGQYPNLVKSQARCCLAKALIDIACDGICDAAAPGNPATKNQLLDQLRGAMLQDLQLFYTQHFDATGQPR